MTSSKPYRITRAQAWIDKHQLGVQLSVDYLYFFVTGLVSDKPKFDGNLGDIQHLLFDDNLLWHGIVGFTDKAARV